MFEPKPTPKDKQLIHTTADRAWEWAKQIEDANTRTLMKTLVSKMHDLAEGRSPL